jgi:hypothetical protein
MALGRARLSVRVMALTVEQTQAPMSPNDASAIEPTEQVALLMRDLRSSPQGLSSPRPNDGCCNTGPTSCTGAAG